MITITRPLSPSLSPFSRSFSFSTITDRSNFQSNPNESIETKLRSSLERERYATRKILLEKKMVRWGKRRGREGGGGWRGGGSSNSEENGLVYLKILGRAARCLGRRGLDETLSIFAPARSPPPPAIASPRASSRPFEPLCQSLRQPPRGSSSRDSSSRPRTSVPGKRRETVPPDRGGRW